MAEWIESLLNKGTERWPHVLCSKFAQNFAWGVFYFKDGDPAKEQFIAACRDLSVEIVQRKRHLLVGKEDLPRYPYYYLRVIDDSYLAVDGGDYLDRTRACPGGANFGRCNTGIIQSGVVEILKDQPKTDILQLISASRFKVYVISRRLKETLVSMNATSVEFLPCKGAGEEFFQLRVVGKVMSPPDVGAIEIRSRCPNCGALQRYQAEHPSRFQPSSLASVDFQRSMTIRSNGETYQRFLDVDIISSRVQVLLASGEFTGWKRYSDGPPIEFGVVEIEGAPWLH